MRTFRDSLLALAILAAGCNGGSATTPDGGADDGGGGGTPFVDVPAATVPEAGVRREVFRVAGAVPPQNPKTMDKTPADLNFTQVLRYRQDVDPPAAARAIVVAMPGLLEGGAGFDALARALVKRGAMAKEAIEVWAIDRRGNLLEDLRGMNTAEAKGDPEIAQRYYFEGAPVGGQTFPGFVEQSAVPFMSEWGLQTHVEDVRKVMALVPAEARKGHLFLMGHSLGASFTEAFAAWRFADTGKAGFEDLAGLIFVDGVLSGAPSTEMEYRQGTQAGGFGPQPGVDKIRSDTRYLALPFLGVEIYARVEVMSMRALVHPKQVTPDEGRDTAFGLLLSLGAGQIPKMTDAAALAFGFDDESCPLAFARASLGKPVGPVSTYKNAFGGDTISHPSDPKATYDWTNALDASPKEWTPLENLAHSFVDGRTNFAEWYFPMRLPIDLAAVGGARVQAGSWQDKEGLAVSEGASIDAPILAVAAGLVPPQAFEALRARVKPAVGAGRPNAGRTRMEDAGFKVLPTTNMTHVDPLTAADRPENPVPQAVQAFVLANAAAGTVMIPKQ